MTANRDKDADKKATLKVLQSINKGERYKLDDGGMSWLGHRDGGGELDERYVFGAALPQSDEGQDRKSVV